MIKIFLDTNILVYAHTPQSPFFEKCDKIFDLAESKDVQISISQRSVWEFFRVVTSHASSLNQEKALESCNYFCSSEDIEVLYDTPTTTEITLKLATLYHAKSGHIFDLNLLALALENEVDIIYTKNLRDFPKIGDIQILDPTV